MTKKNKVARMKLNGCCPSVNDRSPIVPPTIPITLTSGPIFRNVNTDFIAVSVQNVTDSPQTVTVSVLNWQNTCDPEEFPKFGFLCGNLVNGTDDSVTTQQENGDDIFFPPDVPGVVTPFTFTIPARQLFTIQAWPTSPVSPPNPIYEVRVTVPPQPIVPPGPVFPPPPVNVNTWGISASGQIQEGNRVLDHQFRRIAPPNRI